MRFASLTVISCKESFSLKYNFIKCRYFKNLNCQIADSGKLKITVYFIKYRYSIFFTFTRSTDILRILIFIKIIIPEKT